MNPEIQKFLASTPKLFVVIVGYYTTIETYDDGFGGSTSRTVTKQVFRDKFKLPDATLDEKTSPELNVEILTLYDEFKRSESSYKKFIIRKEIFLQRLKNENTSSVLKTLISERLLETQPHFFLTRKGQISIHFQHENDEFLIEKKDKYYDTLSWLLPLLTFCIFQTRPVKEFELAKLIIYKIKKTKEELRELVNKMYPFPATKMITY
jgi:hypothetical protein